MSNNKKALICFVLAILMICGLLWACFGWVVASVVATIIAIIILLISAYGFIDD